MARMGNDWERYSAGGFDDGCSSCRMAQACWF